jgi:GT2 family glycosyltransferase
VTVKVVTIVKDDLNGLKRTEASIRAQSKKVSWILVTPGDDSLTFKYSIELLNQRIVSEVILDSGHGVYPVMNQVINLIDETKWVWFLNAGDEFATNNSYELVSISVRNSTNKWMYGGYYLGSQNGKILGEVKSPDRFRASNQLFAKKYICHQSTIFQAKFLKDLDGFGGGLKIAADWDLMVRASQLDPGLRIADTLSIFYMGGISTRDRQVGNMELFYLRKKYLGQKYAIKNHWWFTYRWLRNSFVQLTERKFPLFVDLIRKFRFSINLIPKGIKLEVRSFFDKF